MPKVKVRVTINPATGMNKTESRYAEHLQIKLLAGEILEWRFEPIRLKLAPKTFYTPDFAVVMPFGRLELHDVKGRLGSGPAGWTDDARVKIKVAAAKFYWFDFVGAAWMTKRQGGPGWKREEFPAG